MRHQRGQLDHLLRAARSTAFGSRYDFSAILDAADVYQAFASQVPLTDYSGMQPWWSRSYQGESDVTWPEVTSHFALSSGTTEGASKYIPVTRQMLKSIMRVSRRQLLDIVREGTITDFLAKDYLVIGGSTELRQEGTSWSGDLSGITTANMPSWFEGASKPDAEIRKIKDWQVKLDRMVEEAPTWDIVIIAGVPAWVKMLLERIIERYQLQHIHEIWPRFSVYIHGGVSIEPYRYSLGQLYGRQVAYYETYLASEGFLAWQSRKKAKGMRLNVRGGIFFEFIEFSASNFDEQGHLKDQAVVTPLSAVAEFQDYAVVISTCSGAWRYLIGDVIHFVDLNRCEIKISGRTKHFLSLCGEHLSVENMNQAIQILTSQNQLGTSEYTVKGVQEDGKFSHRWYIGCERQPEDPQLLTQQLDSILGELNDDYAVERKGALEGMTVTWVPGTWFVEWMAERGKLGSQNKVPRVMMDDQYTSWLKFLEERKTE
ncbi:MAG: GH3 auxin-responsive promoter family protein [Saprospiraceae bacterium]|nr:GH3 auxin-responsive promoter family protein [Saprospiraceae bacterium]